MENYESEPSNIEHLSDPHPFDAPPNFSIEIPKEKSVNAMTRRILKVFGPGKPVVLYAVGRATANAVSCAEIVKKNFYKQTIYQNTKIGQVRTIETWSPVAEGLDPIRVTRSIPTIFILMSLEPLDQAESGFQKSVGRRKDPAILSMSELMAAVEDASHCSTPKSPLTPRSPLNPS